MAVAVAKFELAHPQDTTGIAGWLGTDISADDVVALIGKTEGNGGVNDFSRLLADQAYRRFLRKAGTRNREDIAGIPMVWSGGCDGVIAPHVSVFARTTIAGHPGESRLAIGTAISAEILPEDIGRPAMIEKIAEGVKLAMRDAGGLELANGDRLIPEPLLLGRDPQKLVALSAKSGGLRSEAVPRNEECAK